MDVEIEDVPDNLDSLKESDLRDILTRCGLRSDGNRKELERRIRANSL